MKIMKRIQWSLYIALLMLQPAYAAEQFIDKELKEIQLVGMKDGRAQIQSTDGIEAEIVIGDTIGKDGGIVTEIGEGHIKIRIGDTVTKMLMHYGFEK